MPLSAIAPAWSQCADDETTIEVVIEPDGYPNEISWELSYQGNVIASGDAEGEVICFDATIEQPCLQFSMFDSYGDGIFAPGGYTLYQDGTEIASGGDYGYGETVNFDCAPGSTCTMRSSLTNQITALLTKLKAMRGMFSRCLPTVCTNSTRVDPAAIPSSGFTITATWAASTTPTRARFIMTMKKAGAVMKLILRCCWKAVRPFGSEWGWFA